MHILDACGTINSSFFWEIMCISKHTMYTGKVKQDNAAADDVMSTKNGHLRRPLVSNKCTNQHPMRCLISYTPLKAGKWVNTIH